MTTTTLTIVGTDPVQTGAYSLSISAGCGTVFTDGAMVEVYCPADLSDGPETGTPGAE